MPKFPQDKQVNDFSMDDPLDASKNGGYAPYKMKGSPMQRNFPASFKQMAELKNPIAGASPMSNKEHDGKKLRKHGDAYKRLHWPDGRHRTEREIFDWDETKEEERKEGLEYALPKSRTPRSTKKTIGKGLEYAPFKDEEMIDTVDGRTIDMHRGDPEKPRGSKEHKHSTSYIAKRSKLKNIPPKN